MRVLIMGAAGMVGQKLLNRILFEESGIDNPSELYLHDIIPAHVPSGADGCAVLVGNVADPAEAEHEYGIKLTDASLLRGLSAVIVAVGHDEFRKMDVDEFRKICATKGAVFGDLKSIYDKQSLRDAGFDIFRL